MSENTHRNRSQEHKSSRFAEGRLKLSTSCTECHRRKQKCDQKQPCKHCSRRFPPPQCIYMTKKGAVTSGDSQNSCKSEQTEVAQLIRPRLPQLGSNITHTKSSSSSLQFRVPFPPVPDDLEYSKHYAGSIISAQSLDEFNQESYQNLLSTMVSRISDDVLSRNSYAESQVHESLTDDMLRSSFASKLELRHAGLSLFPPSIEQRNIHPPGYVGAPSTFSISSVDPLHFLGITPTFQSGELLQAFLKVITKYVVSIDGVVAPNYYNDVWVPWAVKSPLLAHLAIFTASCYQSEAQKIPPNKSAVVLGYKLKCISLLNELLKNKETSLCTEAMTAVIYLITNEWYWSNFENVQAHMKGLREMVRLRGGLGDLTMNWFLRNMVILCDYQISCSYSIELSFPHNTCPYVHYPANLSTPLLYSHVKFVNILAELNIAKETATILDDIRFLVMGVLKIVNAETTKEDMIKLSTTSEWIQTRISALPDGSDPSSPFVKDNIYKSARLAALIYCRAIVCRQPLSQACTIDDLNQLWASMWRVTLTRWKEIPGIFIWIILSGNQAAQDTPHGRFLKSTFKASSSYVALENWDVIDSSLMGYVKLQRWLRSGREEAIKSCDDEKPKALSFLQNYS